MQVIDPYAKVFIMGDLNDDPTNNSVKDVLKAIRSAHPYEEPVINVIPLINHLFE